MSWIPFNGLVTKESSTLALWLNEILSFITIRRAGMSFILLNSASSPIEPSKFPSKSYLFYSIPFSKFRGSSIVICVWAFGAFLILGGSLMIFLGYFVQYKEPFWKWPSWTNPESDETVFPPPIQVAGPIIFGIGALLVLIGIISSLVTSQFLNEKLRHYHHRGQPASVTIYTTHTQQPRAIYTPDPYQPLPPPAYPVLRNKYAVGAVVDPQAEMKLYPPVYVDCLPFTYLYIIHLQYPRLFHSRSPWPFPCFPRKSL